MSITATTMRRNQVYQEENSFFPFTRFGKISHEEFQQVFAGKGAKCITANESLYSDSEPIISFNISSGITIFGIETDGKNITKISSYHIDSRNPPTKEIEMSIEYFTLFSGPISPAFFIIGGNFSTTKGAGTILQELYSAIETKFGSQDCIEGEQLNIIECTPSTYLTAGLNMKGELYYYSHTEPLNHFTTTF